MQGITTRIFDVRSQTRVFSRLWFTSLAVALFAAAPVSATRPRGLDSKPGAGSDVAGVVKDSSNQQPLPGAEVTLRSNAHVVSRTTTDGFGRFNFHNVAAGTYSIVVQTVGFRDLSRAVTIADGGAPVHLDFSLATEPFNITALEVTGGIPLAVDTRTGDQTFKQNQYHGAPTNTTSQILQQSIAGAVRAPTGEVHIRGQHAEYTYYVDGLPVPAGISGSLNELFDPAVVNEIAFKTGGWDAEYGNKNTAIVDVTTRIPAGGFHMDASSYVGSFSTNGQSLSASGNSGPWGVFLSGARQATDMRREPVVFDTISFKPLNFHNHGEDLFGFGKIQYTPRSNDVMILDMNLSRTRFGVPFDSAGGVLSDDHQTDINGFVNLGWRHSFAAANNTASVPSEFFGGVFFRHGSLDYVPGSVDSPQFIFFPDTLTPYNLRENRNFNTAGVKLDFTHSLARDANLKIGVQASQTRGHEDFVTDDGKGHFGPASNSDLRGSDVGVYAQAVVAPVEWLELRTGVRYDSHVAPFAGNQHQISPRARLNFFPSQSTSFYLYFGRLFMPTNVEDLRAITSVALQGVVTEPTLPERDYFYEVGMLHRFPYGVALKLSAYRKDSSPGIDDNTVPGSAIVTSVNLNRVWVRGVEAVLEVRPDAPLSGYANVALNHAYGSGPITGGFFPVNDPAGLFDLDHDQRLSATVGATYTMRRLFLSATGIYGSGLTNGVAPVDCGCSYGTSLLDFNRGIKVDPSFIMNASVGYTISTGRGAVRPQIYVENVFDKHYLLKGTFFSGASAGRPRSVQFRVNVGI